MICKKCRHESWCHHRVTGKCESYEWIKVNGPFPLPSEYFGMYGVSYESEYGPECECKNPDLFSKVK